MCRRGHRQACAGTVARSRAALAKGPQADEAQCEAGRTGRVQAMSLRGSRSTTIAGLHRQCGGKWWCSRMRESTHGSNLEIRPGPERRLTCCARIDRVPAPDVTRHSPIAQLRSLHFLCARSVQSSLAEPVAPSLTDSIRSVNSESVPESSSLLSTRAVTCRRPRAACKDRHAGLS